MGVLGGRGIGCLGARGERGTAPGKAPIPRGDIGGELKVDWSDDPGNLGEAMTRSTGLGLTGRPGLSNRGSALVDSEACDALSIPAKEPALESVGDRWRKCASGGAMGTVRGLVGMGSADVVMVPSLGVVGRDFDPLVLFFDKLRNSASF
jgi:hypothetical protein